MIIQLKNCLWKNFAASIDMLIKAVAACPEDYWNTNKKFFYIAYHTAVFLDYLLTIPPKHFSPDLPFTLTPGDIPPEAIDDVMPNSMYSKNELLNYVYLSRKKCNTVIKNLTEKNLLEQWINNPAEADLSLASEASMHCTVLEILFYNMKHVQHHVGQLNLILRQTINYAPDYISAVEEVL